MKWTSLCQRSVFLHPYALAVLVCEGDVMHDGRFGRVHVSELLHGHLAVIRLLGKFGRDT